MGRRYGFDPRPYPAFQAHLERLRAEALDRQDQVAELAAHGLDAHEVAAVIGMSVATVYKAAKDAGVSFRVITSGRIEDRREKVAELTRQGMSAHQIADKLKVTPRTVVRDRAAAGIAECQDRRPLTEQEIATVEALLADGASLTECARTIGRGEHSLHHVKRFKGRGWNARQVTEFATLIRLERRCG